MRILITGCDGQVGWECQRSLQTLGEIIAVGRGQCDLTQPAAVRMLLRRAAPDVIVNAAAYTAVDRAEAQPDLAQAVNALAPALIAEEARQTGASLIHLSTDYVFDGAKAAPYVEDDATGPLSVYGRTKLEGEAAVRASGASSLILRTSWVYATRGHNFLRTVVRLAREREELRIVDDQWGAPTWARSLAEGIASIVARAGRDRGSIAHSFAESAGLYHMTAQGRTNWHNFAQRILHQLDDPSRRLRSMVAIRSAEYPTPARRPANSVLCCDRLSNDWGVALPRWEHALSLALASGELAP
jgi:dTDP-4-dehydrorhamnose reductase